MQNDIGDDAGDVARDRARDVAGDGQWMTYDAFAAARRISRRAAVRMTQRHRLRRQPGNDGHVRVWVPNDLLAPSQRLSHRASQDEDGSDDKDDAGDVARDASFHIRALAALEDALAEVRRAKDAEISTLRSVMDGLRGTVAREEERAAIAERRATEADRAQAGANAARQSAETRAATLEVDLQAKDAELAEQRLAVKQARREAQSAREQAEALRTTVDELRGGQGLQAETHGAELVAARDAAKKAEEAAETLRQAEEARKGRGRLRRAWDGWRGR